MNAADLIAHVLAQPLSAVAYAMRRGLEELRPGAFILQDSYSGAQLETYASEGRCRISDRPGITNLITTYWAGPAWGLRSTTEIRWLDIVWQEHRFETVQLTWGEASCHSRCTWLIADAAEPAKAFWTALSQWSHEVRGEVLVFDGGHWQKDAELFRAIRHTSLDSLVLPGALKDEILEDLRRFLAAKETYGAYGVPWKRGLLFTGPPGNGKTHCVKGLVNRLGVPCLYVKGFTSPHGTPQQNIRAVFERARATTPCLLVLEDLDALITDDNRSFFLNELDGFAANQGIVAIATTNHPERLDPAIRDRPSRFDRTWNFGLPALGERSRYIAQWNATLPEAMRLGVAQIDEIAAVTDQFSFAYLKELFVSCIMRWINMAGPDRSMVAVLGEQATLLRSQMAAAHA